MELPAARIPRRFCQVSNCVCLLEFGCLHFSRLCYFSKAIKYSGVSDNVISNANNASSYLMLGKWFAGDASGRTREIKRSDAIESDDDVKQKTFSKLFEVTALSPVFLFPVLSDKT